MRWILGIVTALAVAWGGYWVWGSAKLRDAAQVWMTQNGAAGAVSVAGFPNRFDLTLTDLDVQTPQGRYAAPFVQIFSMTWKPWHLIAAFAPTQEIDVLDQNVTVTSSSMRASALARPYSGFALREVRLDGADVALVSDQGWRAAAAHLTGALDAADDAARIGLRLTDLDAPVAVAGLPDVISALHLDAHLKLDGALDLRAPQVLGIDIHNAALNWGDFGVQVAGNLAPDDAGFVSGALDITLSQPQHLPQILVALGAVKPDQTGNLALVLTMMGAKATVSLSDGLIKIGPVPLGAAPVWPR